MKYFLAILLLLGSFSAFSQIEGYATSVDSARIYYRIFGKGSPVLIINGGPGMNSNGFEVLAEHIAKKHQAILFDQRGTGKSVLKVYDSTTLTMDNMIADIEAIRKTLKIEKWAVLGHSFGGMVAAYYATKQPLVIDRIIFSASGGIDLGLLDYVGAEINAHLTEKESADFQYWTQKITAGDTTFYAKLERAKALAPAYLFNKKYTPILAKRLTQNMPIVNELMWNDLAKIHFDCSKKLAEFQSPVLIIQGKQDIIRPETAEKAHKVLKNAQVVYMEHCGHYGWLDNKKQYFNEIDTFLAAFDFQY